MNMAKIRLSKKEQRLVQNTDLILTKNQIISKARLLLEQLQQDFISHLKSHYQKLPAEILKPTPKISKGENYLGLPYLILDYPRYFGKECLPKEETNIFAIRTMFWWGHFFSITLHLSGSYKKNFEHAITAFFPTLKKENYFLGINDTEWEHHFDKNNYKKINTFTKTSFKRQVIKNCFLKIAYKLPLTQWDEVNEKLFDEFKLLIELRHQLPSR